MATYRISGVWKAANGKITHYAFHTVDEKSISRAVKVTKVQAITMVETAGNTTKTWIWNYKRAGWDIGETVQVVRGAHEKYLRSDPDNTLTDNLGHLIDYDWIFP